MLRRTAPAAIALALVVGLTSGLTVGPTVGLTSDPASAREAAAEGSGPTPGAVGDRRLLLPARRERWDRRPALRRADRYDFESGRLPERTSLTVRATQDLSRFNLDFLLRVTGVRVNGANAAYDRGNKHELRITPGSPIAVGAEFTIEVRYAGRPADTTFRGSATGSPTTARSSR